MPIYTYKCPNCGRVDEKLQKSTDDVLECSTCTLRGDFTKWHTKMELVLSVPSPMQWGCRKGL